MVSGENTGNQSGVGRDPKSARASHRSTVAERITRPNQSPSEEFLSFSGGDAAFLNCLIGLICATMPNEGWSPLPSAHRG